MAGRSRRALVAARALAGVIAAAGVSAWATGALGPSPTGDAAVTGEVLVSTDGRTLTTSVYWTGCEDRPELVAQEGADTVDVEIVRHRHAPADAVCDDAQAQRFEVALAHPLAGRHVRSAGQTLDTFRESQLRRPAYLPAGYQPSPVVYAFVDDGVGVTKDEHLVSLSVPSWQRAYAEPVRHGALWITQTAGDVLPAGAAATTVNGRPARISVERNREGQLWGEKLVWFDGRWTMTLQEQDLGLTPADVLRVAQGLR